MFSGLGPLLVEALREFVDAVEHRFPGMTSFADDVPSLLDVLSELLAPGEPRFSGMKLLRDDLSSISDVLEQSLEVLSARRDPVGARFSGTSGLGESLSGFLAPGEPRFSGMRELAHDLVARADYVVD